MEDNKLFEKSDNCLSEGELFIQAVDMMYKSNDKDVIKRADRFLSTFDTRKESWDTAIQILSTEKLSDEAYFLASNIIKKKIRYDFGNYTESKDVIEKLSSFLIERIYAFRSEKTYLLINFCKCFSLLTVFAHICLPNIVKVAVEKLNSTDIKGLMAILLIFNYMAENEFEKELVIDEDYRKTYEQFLLGISEDVMAFLDYLIKTLNSPNFKDDMIKSDPNMKSFFKLMNRNIVECFKNWTSVGLNPGTLAKFESEYTNVIDFLFQIDPENIEYYSECICTLLRLPLGDPKCGNLGLIILNKVISFKDRVYQTIEINDEDEMKFFIDIFFELSYCYISDIIVDNKQGILEMLVELSKNSPVDRISAVTEFWYRFSMYLCSELQISQAKLIETFAPMFNSMTMSFLKLCIFEDNIFVALNENKTNKMKENEYYSTTHKYRKYIGDYFQSTSGFVGFNYFYEKIIFPELNNIIAKLQQNMNSVPYWASLEALLFCFENTLCSMDPNIDISSLDTVFDTILDIPESFVQIKRTVTNILDEMKSKLSQRPNLLMKSFNYLLAGLENPLLIKYCSISLKNLLSENRKALISNKAGLIQIYNDKVMANALHSEAYRNILDGIMEVLCCGDNEEEIKTAIVQILSTWVVNLATAKTNLEVIHNLKQEDINSIIEILQIVKIIFRCAHETLKTVHFKILIPIFEEFWPILKFYLVKFKNNHEIIEICTQIIKFFMRSIRGDFKKYLEDYMNIVIEGYRTEAISSYLYAFEVIATVFLNDPTVEPLLAIMYKELCVQTFNSYLNTEEDFESNPTLTEDFFGLLYRSIRLIPRVIIDSELFEGILLISINNIGICHPESANNIISFLTKIITFHQIKKVEEMDEEILRLYIEKISAYVRKHGNTLVEKCTNYMLKVPPEMIYENLKFLIMELVQNYKDESILWFTNNLKDIPPDCLTNTEKDKFLRNIEDYHEHKMEDILDLWYSRCLRRHHRPKDKN